MRAHLVQFVPPSAEGLSGARAAITLFLDCGLSVEARDAVLLALDEIITNAVAHSGTNGSIVVHVARDGDRVTATVRDGGVGFDPHCIQHECPPEPQAEGGRGLYIAIQLMDSVTVYSDHGTIVHMSHCGGGRDGLSEPVRTFASERVVHFVHRCSLAPAV